MKSNLKLLTLIPFLLVSLSCSTTSKQSFSSEQKTSESESLSFDDTLPEECEEEHVLQDDEYRLVLPTYQNLNRRYYEVYIKYNDNYFTTSTTIDYKGGNQPHNNMPPYIAAYCWRRYR